MNDNHPKATNHMLNADKWLRKDAWAVNDAVCLLQNFDPSERDNLIRRSKEFEEQYNDALDTVEKAEGYSLQVLDEDTCIGVEGKVYAEVDPTVFIQWAHSKGYAIPDLLKSLLKKAIYDVPPDSLTTLRESNYWLTLEKNTTVAIEKFPEWRDKQKKIQLTGNLKDWLMENITDNTRELEIIKNVLSEIYKINR
jgi:hypothetical protein